MILVNFQTRLTFEVEDVILTNKNFQIHFYDELKSFSFSHHHSNEKLKISADDKLLLEANTSRNITKIPIKVNTHKLKVQTKKPFNFYLWRGGLTMPLKPKEESENENEPIAETVPSPNFESIREYISGEFREIRCLREKRAALMIEESKQYIEIDIGKMISQQEESEEDEKIEVKVEFILDFYDEWEDDSLFLIQRNSEYLFQNNFKNCKGSISKDICRKQLHDVCRKDKPDSLGHTQTFNLSYEKSKGLILKLSISQDQSGQNPDTEETNSKFEFGLGLYAIFVYRK
jgi:hypothetical protein